MRERQRDRESITYHCYQQKLFAGHLENRDEQEPKQHVFEQSSLLHASNIVNDSKPAQRNQHIKAQQVKKGKERTPFIYVPNKKRNITSLRAIWRSVQSMRLKN